MTGTSFSRDVADTVMFAAVIGAGPHGRRIMDALQQMEQVELHTVVDRSPEVLESLTLSPVVQRFTDVEALFAEGAPELVCVATNGPSHAPLVTKAIAAGARFVMVEKPMACSPTECDQMIAAASQHGVRLSVDNSRRHDPMYRWLRTRIRSGEWGALRSISIQRPGIGLGCLAIHSFDLVSFLSDRQCRQVTAWVDDPVGLNPRGREFNDPGGTVVMEMDGGFRALIQQIEDGAGPMSVELDLTAARVRLDEKLPALEIIERDLAVAVGPGRPPKYEMVEPPADLPLKPNMPNMLRGVLDELIGHDALGCDALSGRHAVEVLVAAHLSHERGHSPVALPLAGADRGRWLAVT